MTESEIMEQNSETRKHRMKWAMDGSGEAFDRRVEENTNPDLKPDPSRKWTGPVFHLRMMGFSDDGKRLIGKDGKDLPQ